MISDLLEMSRYVRFWHVVTNKKRNLSVITTFSLTVRALRLDNNVICNMSLEWKRDVHGI